MAFWKRPEDPWDVDPQKERLRREKEDREPVPSLIGAIKEWNQERKAEQEAREAALAAEPPEKCPWCGVDMERGYLASGRSPITWTPGRLTTRSAWLGAPKEIRDRKLRVDHEGDFLAHKTAWYCQSCGKMVMDTSKMPLLNGEYQWPETEFDQELEKYSSQAQDGEGGEEGETP